MDNTYLQLMGITQWRLRGQASEVSCFYYTLNNAAGRACGAVFADIVPPTNTYTLLQAHSSSVMYSTYTPSTHSPAPRLSVSGQRYIDKHTVSLSEQENLLQKICTALTSNISAKYCSVNSIENISQALQFVVLLGKNVQAHFQNKQSNCKIISAESLAELIQQPALKKKLWAQLRPFSVCL